MAAGGRDMPKGWIKQGITNHQLKILAVIFMTCDHVGKELFPDWSVLQIVGRLAFPMFAFMIAEGCTHTGNRKKYLCSMGGLALFCQLVYFFVLGSLYQGVLVTFTLSILWIFVLEAWKSRWQMCREQKVRAERNLLQTMVLQSARTGSIAGQGAVLQSEGLQSAVLQSEALQNVVEQSTATQGSMLRKQNMGKMGREVVQSIRETMWQALGAVGTGLGIWIVCRKLPQWLPHTDFTIDYGWYGVLLPVVFAIIKSRAGKLTGSALLLILLSLEHQEIQWYSLLALPLIALYNGKRGRYGWKYFFYIYYPLHLAVIYLISSL